jgi:hypothetical protein
MIKVKAEITIDYETLKKINKSKDIGEALQQEFALLANSGIYLDNIQTIEIEPD